MLQTQAIEPGTLSILEKLMVHYKHPQIASEEILSKIRLYNDLDLIAMKINAILGRGKKKDFWDIAELLQHYTIAECIEAHSKKYPSQQILISIPNALTYFADADESEDPISLKGQTWLSIKKAIQQKVNDYYANKKLICYL